MTNTPIPIRLATVLPGVLALAACLATPAQAENIVGLTTTNALLTFDSATPGNASTLSAITGLQSVNERILGIDLRPTTGLLYGISSDNKCSRCSQVRSFVSSSASALGSA